jgi:hypothetical protein
VHKGGKTLQDKTGQSNIGSPVPPSHDSFPLHLRGMHRRGHPRTGAYLDVQRYAAIYARRDAPHRYDARLVFVDIARNSKVPRSNQQFWAEIRHRAFPEGPEGPDHPASPVGRHFFAMGRIGLHSPDVCKDGIRNQLQHFQKTPVIGLCIPPLGENAPILRSHVPI